jgi:hypothetical protein
MVSKITPLYFRAHVTREELGFEKWEEADAVNVLFRHLGWLLRVSWKDVVKREGEPGYVAPARRSKRQRKERKKRGPRREKKQKWEKDAEAHIGSIARRK